MHKKKDFSIWQAKGPHPAFGHLLQRRRVKYFALLLWRSCREATDEVPTAHKQKKSHQFPDGVLSKILIWDLCHPPTLNHIFAIMILVGVELTVPNFG